MAAVPAPPVKPPQGAAPSNPRHYGSSSNTPQSSTVAHPPASLIGTGSGGKADYMILSAAHPPSGDAVYAVSHPSDQSAVVAAPAALHDVDFLQSIAKELPQDSPVLSSVLYTHRSVVNSDAGPDAMLEEVDQVVLKWRTEQLAKAAAQTELQNATAKQESLELHKDLVRREVEHNRALKRMEDLISSLERRFETTLNSNPLGDAWERLGTRHAQLNDEAQRMCVVISNDSEAHKRTQKSLDTMASISKLIITETVDRCVVRADEESGRLAAVFRYRNEGVLNMLACDAREEKDSRIAADAHRERGRMEELFLEGKRRVERHEQIRAACQSLLVNCLATERGLRQNIEFEEEREFSRVVEELAKAAVVLDVVNKAVTNGVRISE